MDPGLNRGNHWGYWGLNKTPKLFEERILELPLGKYFCIFKKKIDPRVQSYPGGERCSPQVLVPRVLVPACLPFVR